MGSTISAGSASAGPELTRHVRGRFSTLEELEHAAEHARGLVTHPGWAIVLDLLGAEIATIDAVLDGVRVLEQADYAAKLGRRSGLRAPAAVVYALIEHAESELMKQRAKHESGAGSSREEG